MDLTVEKRDSKQKAKSFRDKGVLPAVIYGRKEESTPIAINRKAFEKVFKAAGESTVLTLKGLGQDKQALIQEVEYDAVSGEPLHADFYAIEKGQRVTVSVPLQFIGTAPAVKDKGGILVKVIHELEIECEPKDLPQAISVDVSNLVELDSQIKIKDLGIPAALKLNIDTDEVVAMIDVAKDEPVEAPPVDISAIEISEERGKKAEDEVAGAEAGGKGAASAAKAAAPAGPSSSGGKAEAKKEEKKK
ncbi:MAG TPA: 50S ribosomal protein L25 [Candidatus Paceibacterota bacterium]|nr:50S ribosomal protein L25 [Candidatus Paceibacterota bacterium]